MDRWIELFSGGDLLGLSSASVQLSIRKSTGLGLAYYLIGSVILDYKAYALNGLIDKQNPDPIRSAGFVREAVLKDARTRQELYLSTLLKFLSVHTWSLAVCTTILFILDGTEEGLIMYLAYVAAYSGLLLYQVTLAISCNDHSS